MIEVFDAHICAVETIEDMNTFLVALADRADLPSQHVELQRSIEGYDEQDVALGMDTYCVVTSSGATYYGGIVSCVMTDDSLDIRFSKEAEIKTGLEGYRIRLALSASDKALLRSGLKRLFDESKNKPKHLNI